MSVDMAEVRVIVGVPPERNIPEPVWWHFLAIAQRGYPFIRIPPVRIDLARNLFGVHFVRTCEAQNVANTPAYTHLVMLDMDHAHWPNVVEKLRARVAEDPSRLVVSGTYYRRCEPHDPNGWIVDAAGHFSNPLETAPGVYRRDRLGLGCVIIAREVFERIPPPWFYFTYDATNWERGFDGHGEDIVFTGLCQQAGIACWQDVGIESPHLVNGWVTRETYLKFIQEHPEQFEDVPAEREV
jgi:hypothetical protein